jgi:aspartate/methionine/tyrosine aminotransferase
MKYPTGERMDPVPMNSGGEWDREVIRRVMETLRNGETHYVDVPGNPNLRAQLGEYLKSEGIAEGGSVLVTAGIQEARFLTVQVLGQAAGKACFPNVVHPGVRAVLTVRDLDHFFMESGIDHGMLASAATVRRALSDGAKVLYLESPSRLTGACYEKAELDEIISLCKEHGASVIIDSGLHPLVDGPCGSSACRFKIDDGTFVIGEVWPGCGIEDLYVGYILASEDMVKRIAVQKQVISICTSAPSQNGAIASGDSYSLKHPGIIDAIKKKRIELESALRKLGANILPGPVVGFILCEADQELREKLDAAKVQYLDSTGFGIPGYMQLLVSADTLNRLR